ncbi:helix-turn-helix transcriptional regulator [Blastococcus sp. BMG 814]|uniref:Helix-turn-helix transcriptional regulator n=1 Tax=Blastococcus carthaginiensis TaxID=3050034 RepID=A0ABT9IHJ4_9ACTN|nr:helix-turn-helix transcriptional regulator [Blastococcus carthaginiensis]MDP5185057.1 helix-turn-helix transcriptional regulator [Blastococcus carthaginiensis]
MPAYKSARHASLSAERRQTLGSRTRLLREEAGLTVEALAQASGIADKHIQRIEGGKGNPTLATLYALADAVGRHPRDLIPD